ncbi:hypothetical protein [Aphanothece microscopica]|uniref:hypothetical protein n=1 Tax=Aphanothece microscopica TaxID=1049561 RepID=UPI00398515BD
MSDQLRAVWERLAQLANQQAQEVFRFSVDAMWINWSGEPLGIIGVAKRIRWWSEKRFGQGEAFGPHRFRYGIGTVAPIADPEAPSTGAAVLGITRATHDAAYDRGSRASAASRFHAGLAAARALTAPLARNTFARRAGKAGKVAESGEEPL